MSAFANCGHAVAHVQGSYVPCVDGSELARAFFTFAALVGAAMCSAFRCGSHDRVLRFNSGRGLQYLAHVPPPMNPH